MIGARWRRNIAIALLWFIAAATSPAAAETRVLLIGVWKFHSAIIPDLKGPENDLGAMEALMRQPGDTDITVLRNDEVTRTTVVTGSWSITPATARRRTRR